MLADAASENQGVQTAESGRKRTQFAPDAIGKEIHRQPRSRLFALQKRAHVTRNARHTEQSRLLVNELLDSARIHLQLVHQIEHDARIDGAAACPHRQAVHGCKSHRGRHAPAGMHRAHAGAVAEMRDDYAAGAGLRVIARQHTGDIFVRQPVKPVSPDPALCDGVRQCKHLRKLRLHPVESCVKTGHLRHFRPPLSDHANRRQVVRLVQWRKRNEFLETLQRLRVNQRGFRKLDSAVHHPVADGNQAEILAIFQQKPYQVVDCAVMTEARPFIPIVFIELGSIGILGDKSRRGIESFDLTAQPELQLVGLREEKGKLDAG